MTSSAVCLQFSSLLLGKHHRSSSLTCSPNLLIEQQTSGIPSGTKSSQGSPLNLRKHVMIKTNHMDEVDTLKKQVEMRQEALKVISTLNASVGSSRSEDILLKMKQQAPYIFMDLCFYSEVCQLMTHFSFRLSSRRFIQELFMDVSFEILAEDARHVLAANQKEPQSSETEIVNEKS